MKHCLSILILVPLIASCTTNPPDTDTGTLEGGVNLRDQYGRSALDHSGVTVSLVDTDFETMTDSEGNWSLDGVPVGVYHIRLEKDGYGSTQWQVQFVGVGSYWTGTPALYPYADFSIDSVSVSAEGLTAFRARAWITPGSIDPDYLNAYAFYSSTPQQPVRPYRYSVLGELVSRGGTPPYLDGQLYAAQIASDSGWVSGQTVYVTIFPVVGTNMKYDSIAKHEYYSSIDPASGVTVPVTLP